MSFASAPARLALNSAQSLIGNGSLQSIAKGFGMVVGGVFLAAGYHIAYEEGRTIVYSLRANTQRRHARNDAALLFLFGSDLPLELLDKLRRSDDVFRGGMSMLADHSIAPEHRGVIHEVLTKISNGQPHG
jgi:hypothetical protein